MFELKKYHGNRVMSLTYEDENNSFSVGVIASGEYEFGAIKSEVFTVTSGEISSWAEGNETWTKHGVNETFRIPERNNFKLSVEKISSYICFYE